MKYSWYSIHICENFDLNPLHCFSKPFISDLIFPLFTPTGVVRNYLVWLPNPRYTLNHSWLASHARYDQQQHIIFTCHRVQRKEISAETMWLKSALTALKDLHWFRNIIISLITTEECLNMAVSTSPQECPLNIPLSKAILLRNDSQLRVFYLFIRYFLYLISLYDLPSWSTCWKKFLLLFSVSFSFLFFPLLFSFFPISTFYLS